MDKFILVRSPKFAIMPGEESEIVNEGMYGKALAAYLEERLRGRGYDIPFSCAEDWGWWVNIKGMPFNFGACIYAGNHRDGLIEFACTDGATSPRKWNWKTFGFVETGPAAEKLFADMIDIFKGDSEVEFVGVVDEYPFDPPDMSVEP